MMTSFDMRLESNCTINEQEIFDVQALDHNENEEISKNFAIFCSCHLMTATEDILRLGDFPFSRHIYACQKHLSSEASHVCHYTRAVGK